MPQRPEHEGTSDRNISEMHAIHEHSQQETSVYVLANTNAISAPSDDRVFKRDPSMNDTIKLKFNSRKAFELRMYGGMSRD